MKKLIINLLLFLFIAGPFCPLAAMGKEAKAGMSGTSKGEVQLEKRENQDGKKVKIWSLGPARAISHSSSASRDTFVMAMHVVPRAILTAGAELGLFALRGAGMTWRLGFHGMFEIYSKEKTTSFAGYPISDIHFYRGVGGYSLAWSLDRLTQRWLGPGSALETTLTVRHESEHYTGSNEGGEGLDYGDFPYAGDFIMLDLAARWRLGKWDLLARLQHKFFFPGRSAYTHGPGADLHVRWRALRGLNPFVSIFAEYTRGARRAGRPRYPDAYLVRCLFGVIIPSPLGGIYLYLSGDVGHRKGLAAYTEEATFGLGFRIAFL